MVREVEDKEPDTKEQALNISWRWMLFPFRKFPGAAITGLLVIPLIVRGFMLPLS